MGGERNVPSRHYRFASYRKFEAFDQTLTRQLAAGQAQAAPPPSGPVPWLASAYYRLPGATEPWVLSEPDNAWRGYFLPVTEASAHEQALLRRDQGRRWGCLLVVAVVGMLVAWALSR